MNQELTPVKDWLAEGERLFGEDAKQWKFRCPVCGHVQTMADFKAIGAEPQSVYRECIGRHLKVKATNLGGTPARDGSTQPCDYAAYGLLPVGLRPVAGEGGHAPLLVFPFAVDTGEREP